MNAETPFHYNIDGQYGDDGEPERYLVFRTEHIQEGSRGGRTLLTLVPDKPSGEQLLLDVVSMYLDDVRLSTAPRLEGVAVYRGVTAIVSITNGPAGVDDHVWVLVALAPGGNVGEVMIAERGSNAFQALVPAETLAPSDA